MGLLIGWMLLSVQVIYVCSAPPDLGSEIRIAGKLESEVTLIWDKPTSGSFSRYIITVTPSAGVSFKPSTVPTSDPHPSLLLSNLSPSTSYTVNVRTVDSSGTQGNPKTVSFSTLPPQVQGLVVSLITTRSAKVSWKRPTGKFDHYTVESGHGPSTINRPTIPASESNPYTNMTGLIPGNPYDVEVVTVYNSARSEGIRRHFQAVPQSVDASTVIISMVTENSARVQWGRVRYGNVLKYVLTLEPRRRNGNSRHYIDQAVDPLIDLTGLSPQTRYNVTIRTLTYSGMIFSESVSKIFSTKDGTQRPIANPDDFGYSVYVSLIVTSVVIGILLIAITVLAVKLRKSNRRNRQQANRMPAAVYEVPQAHHIPIVQNDTASARNGAEDVGYEGINPSHHYENPYTGLQNEGLELRIQ